MGSPVFGYLGLGFENEGCLFWGVHTTRFAFGGYMEEPPAFRNAYFLKMRFPAGKSIAGD